MTTTSKITKSSPVATSSPKTFVKFPFYRDVSKTYGIIFTGQHAATATSTSYLIYPILFNKETLDIKIIKLRIDPYYPSSFESDFEAFEVLNGLVCVRIKARWYDFRVSETTTGTEVQPLATSDRFNGLKLLKETIDKKSCTNSDPVPVNLSNPMRVKAIDLLLKDRNSDFTITSKDGGKFPVHSFLLSELWPYFSTAGDNLFLPFGKDSVGSMIDFFYGKDVEIKSWNSSVELLDMASVYDIPELKQLATSFMLHNPKPLTFSEAMKAWKEANESSSEAQPVFAAYLKEHASLIEDSLESTDFSETQLLELFCQIVKL